MTEKVKIKVIELDKAELKPGAKYIFCLEPMWVDYYSMLIDELERLIPGNFTVLSIPGRDLKVFEVMPDEYFQTQISPPVVISGLEEKAMSKLRETINRVMWEDHDGGKARLYTTDELEAAIKAYILEIIGEDEQSRFGVEKYKNGTTISGDLSHPRNQLREEQRNKLDGV